MPMKSNVKACESTLSFYLRESLAREDWVKTYKNKKSSCIFTYKKFKQQQISKFLSSTNKVKASVEKEWW